MWKRWLSRLDATGTEAHPPRDVAVAVLLLECARADFENQPAELEAVRRALRDQFGLTDQALDKLVGDATVSAREAVSFHGPVSRLNAELSPDEKSELMAWLWRVAVADGRIDPQEEGLLRKLADLLYIPHADYLRAKLAVIDGGSA
ncbi:putative tellurite resistance protein B-like protein [Panacagrimonas perspica]|uniref:Putative tellurite resistance protein B-like protein n=1 Tax=Panacagrimonas perspica TaxID=381431 RepID=A0A4S3K168_9GAMM|nr:TerB family tellurite resistance protein [Panacagrimonas perspica]TDU30849.1 putative tellurite resistance protein B-like protein [Panacagrimonas perspica]THD01660.1 hypothetical protein B1810_19335 [Panacagrimonas perspica]